MASRQNELDGRCGAYDPIVVWTIMSPATVTMHPASRHATVNNTVAKVHKTIARETWMKRFLSPV